MTTYNLTNLLAGDEISSTYEGRHVNVVESLLTHPTHGDGLVDKGDPVVVGSLVGVALNSATANTDVIVIDTEGIWALDVMAEDYDGYSAVAVGDQLYISATGIISKDDNDTPFGVALSTVESGYSDLCAVKVHAQEAEAHV